MHVHRFQGSAAPMATGFTPAGPPRPYELRAAALATDPAAAAHRTSPKRSSPEERVSFRGPMHVYTCESLTRVACAWHVHA